MGTERRKSIFQLLRGRVDRTRQTFHRYQNSTSFDTNLMGAARRRKKFMAEKLPKNCFYGGKNCVDQGRFTYENDRHPRNFKN